MNIASALAHCCCMWVVLCIGVPLPAGPTKPRRRLQNEQLGLVFDRNTGTLTAIENRLTGETYGVQGDEFDVEAVQFHTGFADAKLVGLAVEGKTLTASYQSSDLTIQARYTLRGHFAEKELTLTCGRNCGLKKVDCEPADVFRPQLADRRLPLSKVWAKARRRAVTARSSGERPKGAFSPGWKFPSTPPRSMATRWYWGLRRA